MEGWGDLPGSPHWCCSSRMFYYPLTVLLIEVCWDVIVTAGMVCASSSEPSFSAWVGLPLYCCNQQCHSRGLSAAVGLSECHTDLFSCSWWCSRLAVQCRPCPQVGAMAGGAQRLRAEPVKHQCSPWAMVRLSGLGEHWLPWDSIWMKGAGTQNLPMGCFHDWAGFAYTNRKRAAWAILGLTKENHPTL